VKKICFLAITVIISSFCLTSCNDLNEYNQIKLEQTNYGSDDSKYETIDKGPVKGGVLKIFSTPPDTLNPVLTNNIHVNYFSQLIYESLVKLDGSQQPVPVLSDRWETSKDGKVWTFHIRDSVVWHDGKPFTAEDVEYTVNTILNFGTKSIYKKNLQNIASFAAVDSSNFRINLVKPNSFTAEMMTFPIIPKHYFADNTQDGAAHFINPIGTGPYKFESFEAGNHIRLTANEKWWNSKNGIDDYPDLPYINKIHVNIYKNTSDALKAFQTRDVDVVRIDDIDYDKYNIRSDLIIKKYVARDFEFLAFNLSNPILADKAVRRAIAYGIDRESLVKELLYGKVVLSDLPIIPGSWLNNIDSALRPFDPEKAKKLLDESGWREINSELYKTINGRKVLLELDLLVNDDNGIRTKVADRISEQLREIGIVLNVKAVSWEQEMSLIKAHKYDIAFLGCRLPSIPDISYLYSDSYIEPIMTEGDEKVVNIAGYHNTNVAGYIEKIFTEIDKDHKKALFFNMKQIIDDDIPYVGMYFYNNAVIYNKRIRGNLSPYTWDCFYNVIEWYLP
jgi:peptide/nickel transport system substrate-binding protein